MSTVRQMLIVGLLAWTCTLSARGQDGRSLKDALAIEDSIQSAIRQAEPSIASILVSRSEDYAKEFGDAPPRDKPGQLGGFDATSKLPEPEQRGPRWGGRGEDPDVAKRREIVRKCDLANPQVIPESYGSGVVIDGREALILTNYHVVRGATKVFVRLPGTKGSYADIHAADSRCDLAVLKLLTPPANPLKEIKMGDGGKAQKGQFVVVLANPFAAGFRDGSPSASWGIISNIQRRVAAGTHEEELRPLHNLSTLLQTDARLQIGCSGGAMLNLRGEMISLTTSRAAIVGSESAGGYAMPMNESIKRIIGELRKGVEVSYGFLGVSFSPVASFGGRRMGGPWDDQRQFLDVRPKSSDRGVFVHGVTSRSPAAISGIKSGDVIQSMNGKVLNDSDDLLLNIITQLAGTEAVLGIQDRREPITVTLAKYKPPTEVIVSTKHKAVRGLRVDYASVIPPRQVFWRQSSGIHFGVLVSEVVADSAAAKAGLKANDDVISHVEGAEVSTPAEFYLKASKISKRAPLHMTLVVEGERGGGSTEREVVIEGEP